MMRRYCADDARRLTISSVNHQGFLIEGTWQWPGDSADITFAGVFSFWANDDQDLIDLVDEIHLICAGPPNRPVWWVRNRSKILKCTISGKVLSCGHQMPLQDSDIVEIGLTSLKVSFEQLGESPLQDSAVSKMHSTSLPEQPIFQDCVRIFS